MIQIEKMLNYIKSLNNTLKKGDEYDMFIKEKSE